MASLRSKPAITIETGNVTNLVCDMPVHATGDLLVACINKDTASHFTTPVGWNLIVRQLSAGAAGGIYAKRAASSSETVTFPLTSETCLAVVTAWKDVFGTTVADAIPTSASSGSDDAAIPYTGVGITTAHNNSVVLHALSTDAGIGPNALPPWVNLFGGDTGANSLCVAYSVKAVAGAVTAPEHWAENAAEDTRGFAIEIRDSGSLNSLQAYIPLSTTPSQQISPLNGVTGAIDKSTYRTAVNFQITSVAGKTMTVANVATAADSGINPFRGSLRLNGASSKTNLGHVETDLTTAFDATALQGLIFGTFSHASPREYLDCGTPAQGGKFVLFGSSSTNWRAWVVGGLYTETDKADGRNNFLIEVATSDTEYASAGTPDWSSLSKLVFGASGYNGAPAIHWNELYLLGVTNLAGGSATTPMSFTDVISVINNGNGILSIARQEGSLVTIYAPIQFGGVEPTHVECVLRTFRWPTKANEDDYVDCHVSANKLGVEFYGASGDTLNFLNCLFTADSSYYWRFNASHNASANVDFSGSTVVLAAVTLRSTVSLEEVNFINCTSFIQNDAALSSCEFDNTLVLSDNPGDIVNCSFSSGGTGHAIEITVAGTYTFTGNEFFDYGADGTTDAAVYNNSGGAVTLNIVGDVLPPTVRNGAGATTTVNQTITLTISGFITGSDVVVRSSGTSTVLADSQEVAGTSYDYAYDGGDIGNSVDVFVYLAGYRPLAVRGFVLGSTDATLPVAQTVDRDYIA